MGRHHPTQAFPVHTRRFVRRMAAAAAAAVVVAHGDPALVPAMLVVLACTVWARCRNDGATKPRLPLLQAAAWAPLRPSSLVATRKCRAWRWQSCVCGVACGNCQCSVDTCVTLTSDAPSLPPPLLYTDTVQLVLNMAACMGTVAPADHRSHRTGTWAPEARCTRTVALVRWDRVRWDRVRWALVRWALVRWDRGVGHRSGRTRRHKRLRLSC